MRTSLARLAGLCLALSTACSTEARDLVQRGPIGKGDSMQPGTPARFAPLPAPTTDDLTRVWVTPAGRIATSPLSRTTKRLYVREAGVWQQVPLPERAVRLAGDGEAIVVGLDVTSAWRLEGNSLSPLVDMSRDPLPNVGMTGLHVDASGTLYVSNDYYGGIARLGLGQDAPELAHHSVSWMWPLGPDDVVAGISSGAHRIRRYTGGRWADLAAWTDLAENPAHVRGGTEPKGLSQYGDAWGPDDQQVVLVWGTEELARITAGGVTRERVGGGRLFSVWGAAGELFVVGAGGLALHFDGTAWKPLPTDTAADLYFIRGQAGGRVVAVGAQGTVLELVRE